MVEYRKAKPEEWENCIELINYVFSHDHTPTDFEKILPKMYREETEKAEFQRVAVDEKGKIRALVALFPETVCAFGKTLSAGYVGSVSVHPKARGEGHMKHLMADWIRETNETCDLLVLDGQRQRYAYYGFTPGGISYVFSLGTANFHHAFRDISTHGYGIWPLFDGTESKEADRFASSANETKLCFVVRPENEVENILGTYGQEAYLIQKEGKNIGYLLASKDQAITELVLKKEEDLLPALKTWKEKSKAEEFTITAAPWEKERIGILSGVAETVTVGRPGSGMFRIVNFARVLDFYLTLKANTTGLDDGRWEAVLENQPVTVTVTSGNVTVEEKAGRDAVILERRMAQELLLSFTLEPAGHPGFSEDIWKGIPRGWFPLPVFWSVADEF